MRIRLEHDGTSFTFERKPMPEGRFRALCTLATVSAYAGMVIGVASMCGVFGVVVVGIITLMVALVCKGM